MSATANLEHPLPGPGAWQLDPTHVIKPASPYLAEIFSPNFEQGFGESAKRYGVLLDTMEYRFSRGWAFIAPRPVGAPKSGNGSLPPRPLFSLLRRLHPELRHRVQLAQGLFERKPWRQELAQWDAQAKPAAIRAHRSIAAVEPRALDDGALLAYLRTCREHHAAMILQHHRLDWAAFIPLGDFLTRASHWSALAPANLLFLMRGASPLSAGLNSEFTALVEALRGDEGARALLAGEAPPLERLLALRQRPGSVGPAFSAYVDQVGDRALDGFDIADARVIEEPEVLLRSLLGAVEDPASLRRAPFDSAQAAKVREAVPPAQRGRYDDCLEEARLMYRLRDERALFTDLWAVGLMRRAVLEAGRRLQLRGRLSDASLLCLASWEEMQALLTGSGGPSAETLAARAQDRAERLVSEAPRFLRQRPSPPPPEAWLPGDAGRLSAAVGTFADALFLEPEESWEPTLAQGLGVNPGLYEGVARVLKGPEDFHRLRKGDVLVAKSTSSAFNIVLPLLGAIVTDCGGILSHAAIVAREYGIPAVVGCRRGTQIVPDGARVRVDGEAGTVRVLR